MMSELGTTQTQFKILVADDDPQIRQLMHRRLLKEGYWVEVVTNGAEAIQRFEAWNPDIVLLDGMMPEVDGFMACRHIKQHPSGAETYVMMMSALDDPTSIDQAFEMGADDYFVKHANYNILKNRLRYLSNLKKSQEDLHQSRNLLNQILLHTPVFMYTTDLDGILTSIQGNAPASMGLPPDNQVGESIIRLYHDRPLLISNLQSAFRGEDSTWVVAYETESITMWHSPLYNRSGGITGALGVGVALDTTTWQDRTLNQLRQMIQILLSNLRGAVYRTRRNPDWELEYISQGSLELTGYTPADLIGSYKTSFLDLIHPDDRAAMEQTVQTALQTKERFQHTYRLLHADGSERWIWEQGLVLPESQPDNILVEGFITDVTNLKQTEETLATERTLLRTMIDNLPDYVFVKDRDGRFMVSNEANARYLGVGSSADVLNRTDYDFFPQERADLFRQDEKMIMQTRQPMLHHEVRVYSESQDHLRWYDITKVPLTDPDNEVVGIVGMIREITTQKEAEQQLVRANEQLQELSQLKSHFLLTMSHELRTPLNSIIGYTDMLLQGILGELNDKQLDRLERVARNGQNLLTLIDDVLDISKIQTGQMEIDLEPVDFKAIMAEDMPQFVTQAEAKGLTVQQDIEAYLPYIYGDGAAIRKILSNLMSNAVKFTQNGSIAIGAQPIPPESAKTFPIQLRDSQQSWVLITVQDTGIGMSAETMQRIFDEFRQADGSATRQQGGIGIGLALCHKFADLMNGHIWLDSTVGYGTTFFVLLPAV